MRKPAQDKRFDAENSFNGLDDEEFETHARIKRYGNFTLTDAIVPSYDLKVTPKTGFRREFRRDGSGAQSRSERKSMASSPPPAILILALAARLVSTLQRVWRPRTP